MALLDLGLLEYFSVIFPALLVFVVVFALLQKVKVLGENTALNSVAAIAIAFMLMLSKDVIAIINFIAPWFVLFFIFIMLLLIVYKMMGASDSSLGEMITSNKLAIWTILIIGIIIIVSGISSVFGERLAPLTDEGNETSTTVTSSTSTEGGEFGETVGKTFFHPKIVGLIFIFLVAVFSIGLLTYEVR